MPAKEYLNKTFSSPNETEKDSTMKKTVFLFDEDEYSYSLAKKNAAARDTQQAIAVIPVNEPIKKETKEENNPNDTSIHTRVIKGVRMKRTRE